ncbi:hypothetical protein PSYJA_23898 [Pseudomonas syringae pv. japonica str. M301072]|uniref:Uncharacterized protein n=1 Tax=Pseudomonas syringae pv. japonica str. M301072 TaxID=629262 RepID=F3FNR4_PSESX|nr:hypothetical protein PSYJA_23898 [Pseudomonas syringae pv. japonica str. M301072]
MAGRPATIADTGEYLAKIEQRRVDIGQGHGVFQADDQRTQLGNLFTEHHIDDVVPGRGHIQRCPQRIRRE